MIYYAGLQMFFLCRQRGRGRGRGRCCARFTPEHTKDVTGAIICLDLSAKVIKSLPAFLTPSQAKNEQKYSEMGQIMRQIFVA